jgi:nitroimidazol reductase NimA-like FMN-containing flavoprotein (pyridoxamine 5'-phosphate oxidase superfamily)
MKAALKQQIIQLLDEHRIMTIATNRPDGWPQATVVGYANDGLVLYCVIGRSGQKYANIQRDSRLSIAISKDYTQPLAIKGLSMAARALVVEDSGEIDHAADLIYRRYPEYKVIPRPNFAEVALLRITPEIVSILDYSKGFGHTDLVRVSNRDLEDVIESRRHHWAWHPVA